MNKRGLLTKSPILLLIAFILLAFLILALLDSDSVAGYATRVAKKAKCIDSDGGRNINVYGTVTVGQTVKKDGCSGSRVREWYCSSGNYASKLISCRIGYTCKAGACVLK